MIIEPLSGRFRRSRFFSVKWGQYFKLQSEFVMMDLPEISIPEALDCRIERRALACSRRLKEIRHSHPKERFLWIWPEFRKSEAGIVTNVRFRLDDRRHAFEVDAMRSENNLASCLAWTARERYIVLRVIEECGPEPLFRATQKELEVLFDAIEIDPHASAWYDLAMREWLARDGESNHRKMLRLQLQRQPGA
ncbi:hypothetical protein [uncultured Jannaschia sp.]|uniref:hypothetical protein n=1 Tax=uncultured Jannaschia sp. TaxID=293347 RepID=UPI002615C44C|nr:hypothetical protein [uncultured Jannaschia sp.]